MASVWRDHRPIALAIATILVAAVAFLVFRGILADGGATSAAARSSTLSTFTPLAEYGERAPHVSSQLILVDIQGIVRNGPSQPVQDLPPISASAFAKPVSRYIRYSETQLGLLQGELGSLETALASGDRQASEQAWETAWSRYLRLGAVYLEGPVANLNNEIDGNAGGISGGTGSRDFSGFHRIEFGLWTGVSPQSLVPWATKLASDVGELRGMLGGVTISPLDFALRSHEILEDAVRDLLSGTDVPWSGQGVLGTQAGLLATREVVATLRPLLHDPPAMRADPPPNPRSPAVVDADLDQLQGVLDSLATANGGQLPSNQELTQMQSERLDAAIGQALEGLAQLPGMLETRVPPKIPSIPASQVKIDR